jgi:hypothetical protein
VSPGRTTKRRTTRTLNRDSGDFFKADYLPGRFVANKKSGNETGVSVAHPHMA